MDIELLHENAEHVATLLKTMAHPVRLMVLCQLVDGELSVADLQQTTNLSQSAFSQQLKVLKDNNLVKVRKDSQSVFYSLSEPKVAQLIASLHNIFCQQ